jgi:hypothetical protein
LPPFWKSIQSFQRLCALSPAKNPITTPITAIQVPSRGAITIRYRSSVACSAECGRSNGRSR